MAGINRQFLSRSHLGIRLLGVLLLASTGSWAQPPAPADDGGPLVFYSRAVQYPNPEFHPQVLVAFPFNVERHQFGFFRADSLADEGGPVTGRVYAQVKLYDTTAYAVDSAAIYFGLSATNKREAERVGIQVFQRLALLVDPGHYTARLTLIDVVSKRQGEWFYEEIEVTPPETNQLRLSDGVLAYRVRYLGDSVSQAIGPIQNGYEVLANPVSAISNRDSTLHTYFELYNLAGSPEDPVSYQIMYTAYDDTGMLFNAFGGKVRQATGNAIVETQALPIKDWPTGRYDLTVQALDLTTGRSDSLVLPFRIISPIEVQQLVAFELPDADPYDTLSLDVRMRLARYFLTPAQKTTVDKLSPEGQSNFLDQFWREIDTRPETRQIENRLVVFNRYLDANRMYSTIPGGDDGWRTDRGRIYMTYGEYTARDNFPSPLREQPYELWYYWELEDGYVFVFVDERGTGDYRLVHSNAPGELFSELWENRIRAGDIGE